MDNTLAGLVFVVFAFTALTLGFWISGASERKRVEEEAATERTRLKEEGKLERMKIKSALVFSIEELRHEQQMSLLDHEFWGDDEDDEGDDDGDDDPIDPDGTPSIRDLVDCGGPVS